MPGTLRPLQQWYCDTCGQLIRSADDGYLEWVSVEEEGGQWRVSDFHIVHHGGSSPRKTRAKCYQHEDHSGRNDLPLREFLGPDGLAQALAFLDVGPHHDPDYRLGPEVRNFREFAELLRRLFLPYYEETRRHWKAAQSDGFFAEANESWPYTSDALKEIIKRYGAE